MEKYHILSVNPVVITSKSCAHGREGCVLVLSVEDVAASRSVLSCTV